MPTLNSEQLFALAARVLQAAGVPAEDAGIVADELRSANLVGHDSHGVMRLVQYVQMIQDGAVRPGGPFEIVRDGPAYLVADAHFNLGQVAAGKALAIAVEKARSQGVASVFVRNCNHVGRLGSYTRKAAIDGFAALMSVNSPGPGGVAPFGGLERKLGTNPISMAAPAQGSALVLDMTTSATAEGKLRVAHQKGESVPDGLIIDGAGRPSTNPAAYYDAPGGAILPLGGPLMGHKGYGMSVMIDVFCGILSGSGVARDDLPRGANGVWLMLLDIERLLPRAEYDAWMETYVAHLKGCRLAPGCTEILLPGEIEERRAHERSAKGVDIPEETWRQISATAAKLGLSSPL
ncbi:MAG: Ldh family oxidoreductase [Planctomycetaceae bacterium]|nr:Ldh family oxidoreductase [Planctomycetaceae bacterium]